MDIITDNWVQVFPNMLHYASRTGGRVPEFEPLFIQDADAASDYASGSIHGRWLEAEEIIATSSGAALNYARKVIAGRWEPGEAAIATNPKDSYWYASYVLKGSFPEGEAEIAKHPELSFDYARDVIHGRFIAGEAAIGKLEVSGFNPKMALDYMNLWVKGSGFGWSGWTEDQIRVCPCWLYNYAKQHCKGRLPDNLHNSMLTFGMTINENYWVKKYFKAAKYQKKVKRRNPKEMAAPIVIPD